MNTSKVIILLLTIHTTVSDARPSRIERIVKLEEKIVQLEQKMNTLESDSTMNTYTKIYLRSLKINILKSSFTLALLLELFDKAEDILKKLEKIEDKSTVQKLRKKLKNARKRQKQASQ